MSKSLCKQLLLQIIQEYPDLEYSALEIHRKRISRSIANFFKNTVAYGPFKDLILGDDPHWGESDKGAMILGLYEQEVLGLLSQISRKNFIDLGAADGYYGIGTLVSGICEKSFCYEITEKGRETIRKNASLNHVLEKCTIRGKAENGFFKDFSQEERDNSILFVDIEGGEFDLFDQETFYAFKNSTIIIELHEWFYPDGKQRLEKLKNLSAATHQATEIKTGLRDLSVFPEIQNFNDTDRWLLCSEGRARLMSWLILNSTNKQNNN